MLDDLAGKRTGERIQILRERKGLNACRMLAGLVKGMRRLAERHRAGVAGPRCPSCSVLVKLRRSPRLGDVRRLLAGTDMDLARRGAIGAGRLLFAR